MRDYQLTNKITVLVNSCDAYCDLWFPFFTLFKKYAGALNNVDILLNTESKEYYMDGLNIRCVHPDDKSAPYGSRMINALHQIKTPFVLSLLDDFFLRKPANIEEVIQIIQWMDDDESIAYFNCDATPVYTKIQDDRYQEYRRIPIANEYTLNMQAAIWRTDILTDLWSPYVSPWEWEVIYNLKAARSDKYKFYCKEEQNTGYINYGFELSGGIWGVYRGKWVRTDVEPFFLSEGINLDFSKRGFYTPDENKESSFKKEPFIIRNIRFWASQIKLICRIMPEYLVDYIAFSVSQAFGNKQYSLNEYAKYKIKNIRDRVHKE